MLTFLALASLVAVVVGWMAAGVLGVLTGIVAVVGTGSGLAILIGAQGTGLSDKRVLRSSQRVGGIVAAMLCALGALHGGWGWGWAWGLGGYVAGMVSVFMLFLLLKLGDTRKYVAAQQAAFASLPDPTDAVPVPIGPFPEFMQRTSGGRPNRMDMSIYVGHPFACACGETHTYFHSTIPVLRELPGMRLVFACPDGKHLTCVKVLGIVQFKGFESLFGTSSTSDDD